MQATQSDACISRAMSSARSEGPIDALTAPIFAMAKKQTGK
jgi:hypothetical protein